VGVKIFVLMAFLLISINGYGQTKLEGEYIAMPSSNTNNRSIVFEENGTFTVNQSYYPPQGFTLEPYYERINCSGMYRISGDTIELNIPYKQLNKDSSRYIVIEEKEIQRDMDGREQADITMEVFSKSYHSLYSREGVEYLGEEKLNAFSMSLLDNQGKVGYYIRSGKFPDRELNDIMITVYQFNKICIYAYKSYVLEIDTRLFKNKKVKLKCILYQVGKGYCRNSGGLPHKFLIKKCTNKKLVLQSLETNMVITYLKKG